MEGLSVWLTKYSYSSSGEEELFRQLELTAWSLGSWPPAGQERIVNFPRIGSVRHCDEDCRSPALDILHKIRLRAAG